MVVNYLLDSNIIIYHLNGVLTDQAQEVVNTILAGPLSLSIITKIEVLGFKFDTIQQKTATQAFLKTVQWLPLTNEIADQAITLRQEYRLKTPDAIIAATAIVFDCTLVSRNDKDFQQLPNLLYLNPFQ